MMAAMKNIALLVALLLTTAAQAAPLRVLSWNVESGGSDPAIIARQLAELGRYDVYCLQEVDGQDIGRYAGAVRQTHGKGYRFIASHTGRNDRLLIVFDDERFDLLEARELFQFGKYELNTWRHRSPLVLVLRDTKSGSEFNIVTVHLARGDRSFRREQANGLREWVKGEPRPTILIGDCNFDYHYQRRQGNQAFVNFTAGNVWRWVRPAVDVDSNWSDRDGDGKDNYPGSVLDFAFVAGESLGDATAEVVVRAGDFPDSARTSDHRPVSLVVE